MIKKIYDIIGFDCANCAAKTERHLSSKEEIEYCRIDFAQNKLYINYKKEELSVSQILDYIKEVETDEIKVSENTSASFKKIPLFTKAMMVTLIRTIISLVLGIVAETAFGSPNFFWVRFGIYVVVLIILCYDIVWKVINRIIHLENPFDEYLLITISAIGALTIATIRALSDKELGSHLIGEHALMDGAMVVLLFHIGKIIESIATNKSKNAVMSAIDSRVEVAHLVSGEELIDIDPTMLKKFDLIVVRVGETILIDGDVIEGEGFIDVSSLTGEYVPVSLIEGQSVLAGSIVKNGTFKIKASKKYQDSTIAKIINLISNSGERKSKADHFVSKFARVYTPLVLLTSISFLLIGGFATHNWLDMVFKALEILVVACPCAIVISVPLAYFSGIGLSSKNGILIKGTNYLDELNELTKLVTDKTGTLTKGVFSIQKIVPIGVSEQELLEYLYVAECHSNHPIAKAITHNVDVKKYFKGIEDYEELAGLGVMCVYQDQAIFAGSYKLLNSFQVEFDEVNDIGTIIYVAVDNNYIGYVVLNDEIKENSKELIKLLHKNKISTTLLTGDKKEIAMDISSKLGIDEFRAELLPEDKVNCLEEEMKNNKGKTAFVGDGINDAASIRLADVGIAMGGVGSDVAVENADIVIMNDDPIKIYDAIKIAKMARHTAIFNIIFSLLLKISVIILCITFEVDMFIAVLADTGLTVLMVINSLLVLYRKIKR